MTETADFATDLSALAPGCRVLLESGYGRGVVTPGVVVRVTATQVVVRSEFGRDSRFAKAKNYRRVGDSSSYNTTHLVPATPRNVLRFREGQVRDTFHVAARMDGARLLARLGWERAEEIRRLLASRTDAEADGADDE